MAKKRTEIDGNKIDKATIEEKAESKSFFNKRNMVIIILTSLLSLALVVVTVLFIMDMSWGTFFTNIGNGLVLPLGWLWLLLLILFAIFSIVYNFIPIWIRLRELGIKIKAWQYFTMALSVSFLKGVTPANFVTDPYMIFWLKTQGVSTSRATSIIFSNAFIWQCAALLIHIPSFIIIMLKANILISMLGAGGMTLVVLMGIGIFIDVVGVLVMILLCFSKKAHYVVSSIFNWFKKKLHLKYHSKAEIAEKYEKRATIKNDVIGYFQHKFDTVIIVLLLASYELVVYFTLSSALAIMNQGGEFSFDVLLVYHSANMAFNANRLNLIPGLAAGLEASLLYMLKVLGGISGGVDDKQQLEFISQGIFLWRTFYTYFPAVIGLFGFGGLTIYHVRSYKKKKGAFIESKYE